LPRTFGGFISGMVRASIRAAEQAHCAAMRGQQREQRRVEREAKANHNAKRQEWVNSQNTNLKQRISDLISIGASRPHGGCTFSFSSLRREFIPTLFNATQTFGAAPSAPRPEEFRTYVRSPGLVSKCFGGQARYERRSQKVRERDRIRLMEAEEA
jgi:hypothetical protein